MSLRQPETPIQGVKRKRKISSNSQSHSKKQRSNLLDPPDKSADAFQEEDDDDDGDQHPTRKEVVVGIPSRQSKGMLTPISKRKKNMIRARKVLPVRTIENPDEDSVRREPESPVDSDAKKPLHFLGNMQSGPLCPICGMEFGTPKSLKRHLANPRVHRKWHKCGECEEAFYQPGDLKIHQDESGHNTRFRHSGESRGAFTEREKVKLTRFKRRFCSDHSISEFEFNKLMTLLGRRDGSDWPNPDVTKAELRDMFYDVLPDRNRKSMNRYRERYFQNVEQDTEWTEKQINELRNLVKEKGRKWVEIGEALGRTQDSVYQKWKNRIRQGDVQRFDRWEEEEIQALILAVRQCKTAAGVPQDISSDDRVNWTSVSDLLGKRRNAQQCSTFWKRVYRKREEAKARGKALKTLAPGRSKPEPTISQRQPRSRVTRDGGSGEVITPRRRVKSAMYVTESDVENIAPEGNARSKKGKKRVSSDIASIIPRGENDLEDDVNGRQSAETAEESDENDDDDDDKAENDSPSKNPNLKRLGGAVISSSAPLKGSSEPRPTSTTQPSRSFQAVNSQSLKSDVAAPQSSQTNRTPRLLPLSKKTPKQINSLSQAFKNTQAPTSARTGGLSTPGKKLTQDRPSPDIKMQLKPLRGKSHDLEPEDDNEDGTEPADDAVPTGPDFAIYESENEDSNDGASAQTLSSAAPLSNQNTSAEAESEGESDSEGQFSDNEQQPKMFSSAILQDADEATGAEIAVESEVEVMETIQNGADSEAEEDSEDEALPETFDSAALKPDASDDSDAAELKSEDYDTDEPPHVYSSTVPSEPASQSPVAGASDTDDEDEAEAEAEEEDDEDDDSPPEMFTSALPNVDVNEEDAASSDSSGDAATIPPYGSDDDDHSHNNNISSSSSESESEEEEEFSDNDNGSGSNGDGSNDSDQSMIDATQIDFFANLEASAKKVRAERQMRMESANVGRKIGGEDTHGDGGERRSGSRSCEKKDAISGGKKRKMKKMKKNKKEVFDVSSSSSSSSSSGGSRGDE
jgi:Myb-like DNA-binding domain